VRNTPAWPFLVGAGAAVLFAVFAGLARGGVEQAWLTFFPWLTVAAVAPQRQAGPPVPSPLLLTGAGAAVAVVLAAILDSPW
jgi:methylthioxylose transferase